MMVEKILVVDVENDINLTIKLVLHPTELIVVCEGNVF
jgi:hypothetical protein